MLSEIKLQFPSLGKNRLYAIAILLNPSLKKVDFKDPIPCSYACNKIREKLQKHYAKSCTPKSFDFKESVTGKI